MGRKRQQFSLRWGIRGLPAAKWSKLRYATCMDWRGVHPFGRLQVGSRAVLFGCAIAFLATSCAVQQEKSPVEAAEAKGSVRIQVSAAAEGHGTSTAATANARAKVPRPASSGRRPVKVMTSQQMIESMRPALSRSTEGLVRKRRADGITTVDLQGRFQQITLAKPMPDGTVKTVCVDNVKAAAAVIEGRQEPAHE